ncbi:hypothetical protein [Methanoculleus sp.]|jgi:hypothetical protein|uniref:hypothetical protein n=1 Tax=Methanoculleus sp. TaxID=90427 RepID=UPI001BD29FDC|nr:hypothetical protein [Methanoculleus sp.]
MGKSKYTVTLTDDQRSFLETLFHRGKSSDSTIRHAYILLHADKSDPEVAETQATLPDDLRELGDKEH